MSRPRPRAAVLYNAPTLPAEHPDAESEREVVGAARAIRDELNGRGLRAWLTAARQPVQRLVRTLSRRRPDVVFNLIEGFGGRSSGEVHVTSLLELMGLAYTGCPPEAQALGLRKGRAKALLRGLGLPTAPFAVVEPGDETPDLGIWPVIVKPDAEDASLGIEQESVVIGASDLPGAIGRVRGRYGPRVLVEAFLPGREFNVGVLALTEPIALPIAEVVHDPPPGAWPILSYRAKWDVGSDEDLVSPVRCPAEIAPDLADRLAGLALAAFRAMGCRDYARVDLRLDGRGAPMILEVNPNPDLAPSAGLARMIAASGRDYGETIAALARQALERGPSHE